MRALAADTTRALAAAAAGAGAGLDASASAPATRRRAERARQDRRLPTALVTTPESLTLMLTREHAREDLQGVHTVIVDEWHELIGNKRGVQVQLALARLRRWQPALVVWGLSATLGNLDEAMHSAARREAGGAGAAGARPHRQDSWSSTRCCRTSPGASPGAGTWARRCSSRWWTRSRASGTTLVFTNVRSQAEIWYQLLLEARPEWAGEHRAAPRLARPARCASGSKRA